MPASKLFWWNPMWTLIDNFSILACLREIIHFVAQQEQCLPLPLCLICLLHTEIKSGSVIRLSENKVPFKNKKKGIQAQNNFTKLRRNFQSFTKRFKNYCQCYYFHSGIILYIPEFGFFQMKMSVSRTMEAAASSVLTWRIPSAVSAESGARWEVMGKPVKVRHQLPQAAGNCINHSLAALALSWLLAPGIKCHWYHLCACQRVDTKISF